MTYWERLLAEYVGGGDSPISPTLIAKSITTNGTYNAVDDEADGYSSVSVNVPNTSTLKGTLPLTFKTSEEQLRDWTIYGSNYEHTYSAEGTLPLTFTSHMAGNADNWSISGNDNAGKNKLEITEDTTTKYDVTFTVNSNDGSIVATGTCSSSSANQAQFNFQGSSKPPISDGLISDGMIISCENLIAGTRFSLAYYDANDSYISEQICDYTNSSQVISIPSNTATYRFYVRKTASAGGTTVVFKPMLRSADTSETFEPYQQGVGEMTKNILDISSFEDIDQNNVVMTLNDDNATITVYTTDTPTANMQALYNFMVSDTGNYLLSGVPEVVANTSLNIYIWDRDASGRAKAWDKVTDMDTCNKNNQSVEVYLEQEVRYQLRVRAQTSYGKHEEPVIVSPMVRKADTTADFIPYGYEIPLNVNGSMQDIYIGRTPLTAGQSVSKTSTGVDVAVMAGSNTITTGLYNKPSMSIEGVDYVGVGEPINDSWQIPLTVSDGTNTATVNVPIDAPLTSTDSVSSVVDIPTYVGTNTIDTTLVEPVTADIVYVGANSTLINKTINQNGTYFAYSDNANGYNSVSVNVPNTYTNEDESKVVHNGELVAQTTTSVTTNGIVDTTAIRSVSVEVPTAGSVTGDVRFLDYDGTVVQAYSKSDFASLTALPANPTHEGLTAQGWNWSLEDAKTYVAAYDKLDIGQMYITNDGKTRLYVTLDDGRLNPTLAIAVNGSCDVDWGDGTTHDTLTDVSLGSWVAVSHTYAASGDYVIALTVTGAFAFVGDVGGGMLFSYNDTPNDNRSKGYRNILRAVELGDGITDIYNSAFRNYYALSSITIPNSVTVIDGGAFYGCYALSSVTIPNNVTRVTISVFDTCYALSSVTIPNSVTDISSNAFRNCYALLRATIPNSVTSIGNNVFYNCYALLSVTIPNSVTDIGTNVFYNCYALSNIAIPDDITSISNYVFYNCYALSSITIPDSVTSITTGAFYSCTALSSITIPSDVASIGSSAFYQCYGLGYIKFTSATPPTVANSNTFASVPTDCIIYIPTGSLADYTSAQYYPSSSSYTYVEY